MFCEDSAVAFPLAIRLAARPGTDGKLWRQAEMRLPLPRVPSPLPAECTARESCNGKPANVSWKPAQPAREVGWVQDERDRCRPCWLQTVPDKQQRERAGRGLCSSLPGPFAKTTVTWGRSCFNQKRQQGSSGFFQENGESEE